MASIRHEGNKDKKRKEEKRKKQKAGKKKSKVQPTHRETEDVFGRMSIDIKAWTGM